MPLRAKDIFQSIFVEDTYNVISVNFDSERNITSLGLDREGWFVIGQQAYTDMGSGVVFNVSPSVVQLMGNYSLAKKLTISGSQFRHGSIIDLNSEISDSKKFIEKYPLVYFVDKASSETYTGDRSPSAFTHEGRYTIYFLTEAQFSKWRVVDYDTKAINQMLLFSFRWIQELRKITEVRVGKQYDINPEPRFAVYYTNKGEEEQLVSEDMSGVRLELPVSFYKCSKSNCNTCQ